MSVSPLEQARREIEQILSAYSYKQLLEAIPDTALEQVFYEQVIPLNITSLAQAKAEIQRRTGFSPDFFGISQEDQEQIWEACERYMKQIRK